MGFYLVEYRSACCGAGVQVATGTTQYHICRGCSKPCDAIPVELAPLDSTKVDTLEDGSGYRVRAQ